MTGPYREASEQEPTLMEQCRKRMEWYLSGNASASERPATIVATAIYVVGAEIVRAIEEATQASAKAGDDAMQETMRRIPGWKPRDDGGGGW